MASLKNVVGDDRFRLVYGVDLMRGIARIDPGTGGGSPSAADDMAIFNPYAQTAGTFSRNGSAETVSSSTPVSVANATAGSAAHTHRRSAASFR